jgi:FkbH-like protein
MSNDLFSTLAWLPAAPADFGAEIKALHAAPAPIGQQLRHLAGHALDENKLSRLAKLIIARGAESDALEPLIPFRLGVVSHATSHFLVPALIATAARHGFALECIEADYGQVMQQALAADSEINAARCDAVLLAIDHRGLPLSSEPGDMAAADHAVDLALAYLDNLRQGLRQFGGATSIVQTVPRMVEPEFGSLDLSLAGTHRQVTAAFNQQLARRIGASDDLLLDVAGLAESVGLADWHDTGLWNIGKIPFANQFLPAYAELVCRLIGALRGKSRRCLILDLDNTLWSGVVGDDGVEGILLGQGDATGEAHQHLQRVALQLRRRGVVLAVSSKNHDEIARRPFREHPEMLLREDHIAVFQANWNDKATNIEAIAKELALGLDAMVFVDDNPAERALVRRMLPEVAVPEMPADAALYARTLLAAGYFESIGYSPEDRQRADFYQNNAKRVSLHHAAGDLGTYLQSLNMTIQFQPFDAMGRSRIAQLISKSNQFNLTTRRYNEAEVAAMESDADLYTLQVRLSDVFGDNGMISVVVCRKHGGSWDIELWLMSCRVLGRGVEQAVLQELAQSAMNDGATRLTGRYIATERNQLVADHYPKLGFTELASHEFGVTDWELDLHDLTFKPLPMTVVRQGALQEA